MRIAIITNSYPPRLGGLELHIENLAQGLRRLGHEVWVLTISSSPGQRCDDGVQVLTGRAYLPIADVITVPALGTTRALTRFLREHRIDVCSVHTRFFPMSLVGLRAAHAAGIPVIHTEHGSDFVASPSPIIGLGARSVDMVMGRYILRHADTVLGVSERATAFVERLSGVHGRVFYNAITPAGLPVEQHRPLHCVFVGRLVPGKGWDTFITALAQVRAAGIEATGEILGAGADLDKARAAVRAAGLEEHVAVRGRVDQDEVRRCLMGATLVNPTILSEGFQTTLLECIDVGGRVVTFDVPGAELLRDQGAPVTICEQRSAESLATTLMDTLPQDFEPADPSLIEAWSWPVRAQEYAQIAQETIEAYARTHSQN